METVGDEPIAESGERQPRRSDIRVGNQPIEPDLAGQRFELQLLAGGEEIPEAQPLPPLRGGRIGERSGGDQP